MSLVEQAIARMRNQSGPERVAPESKPAGTPAPVVADDLESTASMQRIAIDVPALRAAGYLPEENKDRQFADHYRRIKRTLIDNVLTGGGIGEARVIMVTSALPGDGKTFSSINLALSMALERDISVLLVDCDVAKRHISQIMGLKGERGLLDSLSDDSLDVESLVLKTDMRGLSILPAGNRVESPAELLSSKRMRQLMRNLCDRNPRRILLLDSPPLLITNEGRTLVKIAGQIVLVVRAGHTPRPAVQEAVALFDPQQQAGGVILNEAAMGSDKGYYGYGNYGTYGDNGSDV
jgi:exopolysaccharide/PEP-CTERM locus tyrosine autokinase